MSSQTDVHDRTSEAIAKVSRRVSGFSILLSIALIVCGCLAILLPIEMSLGVVIVISWLLMIGGVVQLIDAIRGKTTGSRLWEGIIAVIYFSMGLFLRFNVGIGIAAFTFALIWFFVVQGVIDVFAYDLNETGILQLLLKLAKLGRVRLILDNSRDHHDKQNSKPEDQFAKLFTKAAGSKQLLQRGKFKRFAHDKVIIVYKDSTLPPNYSIFGQVTGGLDVVSKIGTDGAQGSSPGKPKKPVTITTLTVDPTVSTPTPAPPAPATSPTPSGPATTPPATANSSSK